MTRPDPIFFTPVKTTGLRNNSLDDKREIAMFRFIVLKQAFATLVFLIACSAFASESLTVELSADASRTAINDLVQATIAAEASGTTPGDLSRQINLSIGDALKKTRTYPSVKAKSGGTSTYPIYGKNGRIESWRMRSEIIIESGETAELSELLGKLQSSLVVSGLVMLPSPETRRKAENEAILDAIELFKNRARLLAEALGKSYSIRELSVSTGSRIAPPMLRSAKTMIAESASMPMETGESLVTVSVSGKIEVK